MQDFEQEKERSKTKVTEKKMKRKTKGTEEKNRTKCNKGKTGGGLDIDSRINTEQAGGKERTKEMKTKLM